LAVAEEALLSVILVLLLLAVGRDTAGRRVEGRWWRCSMCTTAGFERECADAR
jgi:hypothetical protein